MPQALKEKRGAYTMGERLSFPWTPHGLNAERTCVSAARTCHGGLLRSVAPSFIFCYASERVRDIAAAAPS